MTSREVAHVRQPRPPRAAQRGAVLLDRRHEVPVQGLAQPPLVRLGAHDGAALDLRLGLLLPRELAAVVDDADDECPPLRALRRGCGEVVARVWRGGWV